jgi:large subunit ribosomal protein L28
VVTFDIEEVKMAKRCAICGKKGLSGSNISHAHNVTRKKQNPNLQRVRAVINGKPKLIWVCTRCLRSGKVVKA